MPAPASPRQAGELGPDVTLRSVVVGPVELAIAEAGVGGRPLLLVHGFTGAKEDFCDWFEAFAEAGFHVVAPDLAGHGASSKPVEESAYSLEGYANDIVGLVDALGWDRFALLGHSMGGMIAEIVAIEHPERLERLVLMDTHHGPVEGLDPDMRAAAVHVVREGGIDGLIAMATTDQAPLSNDADARVRAERAGYVEFGERKLRASSPAMFAAMAEALVDTTDRLESLGALKMPVLILVGELDTPFRGASQRMANTVPGARLAIIADGGHSPQFEAPQAWWDTVSGFLTESDAS